MSDTTVEYNMFDPEFPANPYKQYRVVREGDPVYHSQFGVWLLFRYDDVLGFLRDNELSVEDRNAHPTPLTQLAQDTIGEEAERGSLAMLNRDPPDHTRLRRLVSKAFTPRTVENLRPRVQQLVDEALDRAAAAGGMEVMGDFAFPLPFTVISEMLGMPDTDSRQLREWSGLLVRTLEPVVDTDTLQAIAKAGTHMRELVSEAIAWKRANPADDMLTALIAAEEHGDVLSDDELIEQVMLLYIAGHETTVNLIGNGVLALARHEDQRRRLRHEPELIGNAVEELLRYDSPVQMSRRITLREVELDGKTIEPGAFVGLVLASANRDPLRWGDTAEELDLAREGAHGHVSFGGGAHYCLGAALARLEGQVAIGSLVQRFATWEPAGEPAWNGRLNLRGLDQLPLSLA
ncbi:MAG: cytochrome P450 [Actinomycetota bacterium]|nr:cytochrome P450 [Actinomycetota bacterium]